MGLGRNRAERAPCDRFLRSRWLVESNAAPRAEQARITSASLTGVSSFSRSGPSAALSDSTCTSSRSSAAVSPASKSSALDGFVDGIVCANRHHRTEDLLLHDLHLVRRTPYERRRHLLPTSLQETERELQAPVPFVVNRKAQRSSATEADGLCDDLVPAQRGSDPLH